MADGSPSRSARGFFLPGVLGVIAVLSAALSAIGFAVLGSPAQSTPEWLSQFNKRYGTQGSKLDSCQTCHTAPAGNAENVNQYGKDFAASNHDFGAVEGKDSDGDGATNVDEIKAETYPGDANDNPQKKAEQKAKPAPTTTTTTRPFPFSLLPGDVP